jgi:hypothetical protein
LWSSAREAATILPLGMSNISPAVDGFKKKWKGYFLNLYEFFDGFAWFVNCWHHQRTKVFLSSEWKIDDFVLMLLFSIFSLCLYIHVSPALATG